MDANAKKQELEQHIVELERSIAELRMQLKQLEEADQHEAIDHLEACMEEMEHRWDGLKEFWPLLRSELREMFVKMKGEHK